MKTIRFSPAGEPLILLRTGMPPVILLLIYIFIRLQSASGAAIPSALRECKVMMEYALMSLAILAAGAAAFEKAAQSRR